MCMGVGRAMGFVWVRGIFGECWGRFSRALPPLTTLTSRLDTNGRRREISTSGVDVHMRDVLVCGTRVPTPSTNPGGSRS